MPMVPGPLLLALFLAAAGAPAPPETGEAAGDDLLVLELRLDGQVLVDGITGYRRGSGVLLPLGEVVRALDLPVAVEPVRGTAEGWFLEESRGFSLDCGRHEAVVEGRRLPFDPGLAVPRGEDIWVDSALLGTWFPVRFELDLPQLAVLLIPREKLPFELRREREAQARGLRRATPPAAFSQAEAPRRLLDWPAAEGTLTWSLGPSGASLVHDARWTGDLFGMTGELEVRGRQGGEAFAEPAPVRLTLERKDPEAGLLGPWRATEVALGTVATPDRPLVLGSQPVQGALLSSFPLDREGEGERITLSGNAPPGWEVELYRDEALIGLELAGTGGTYHFREIPVFLGANLFRLVFHGPQGQRREEQRRILVGEGWTRPGETHYRIVAGRLDAGGRDRPLLVSMETATGLRKGLTAGVSLDSVRLPGGRQDYGGLSLDAGRGGVFGRLDLVRDRAGGWAVRTSVRSFWRDLAIFFQHDQLESLAIPQAHTPRDRLHTRSLFRLDGLWHRERARPVGYSLTAERVERVSGDAGRRVTGSVSGGLGGLSVMSLASLDLAPVGGESTLEGSLLASGSLRKTTLRGELGYRAAPEAALRSLALTAERPLGGDRLLRLAARHTVSPLRATGATAELGWPLGCARLDLAVGYDRGPSTWIVAGNTARSLRGWTTRITLGYSLRREPFSGRWQMSAPSRTAGGAVAARVFLDRDLDGRFGAADEPLSGVRLQTLQGGPAPVETDAQGIALLAGLPLLRRVDLAIDPGSLVDPAWVPVREGAGLTLRPGAVPRLDFPVAVSGEVEGTVRLLHEKEEARPAANVRLQLVDPAGHVIRDARSESDGFYLFERVPPGRYTVRIDPEQLRRLHLAPPSERTLEIGSAGDAVRGVDFELVPGL